MTSALIISIVDIAAFCEMAHLRITAAWVFTDYAILWLVLALLSMFGGALLALAQKNIKRMLAFSTIDDMGYLVLGTLVGTQYGLNGAILAALSHAFFKVLLFGAVGVAEKQLGHDLTLEDHALHHSDRPLPPCSGRALQDQRHLSGRKRSRRRYRHWIQLPRHRIAGPTAQLPARRHPGRTRLRYLFERAYHAY